ncbi:hypothetical protein [Rhodanobacter sp. OK091]|uniref:hypothetical protein n=1 Tax=Rhodanobacter sp. OK091 TaxID=1881037 RepID=UPI000921C7D1|nr:hypothetical protein [Rhodanobacter sp. OK091]SHM21115.1 hypothetical protein SAMN05428972_2879 [Rhodanobacter sp. OK091]
MKIQVDTAHSADRHARVDSPSVSSGLAKALRAAPGPRMHPLAIIGRVVGGME